MRAGDLLRGRAFFIYAITNDKSGYVYIGCTISLNQRRRQHEHAMRDGSHTCPLMVDHWRKHGPPSFRFEVLASAPDERTMYERERFWQFVYTAAGIKMYNPRYSPKKPRKVAPLTSRPDRRTRGTGTVTLRKDGLWAAVRPRAVDPTRKPTYFKLKADAEAWLIGELSKSRMALPFRKSPGKKS